MSGAEEGTPAAEAAAQQQRRRRSSAGASSSSASAAEDELLAGFGSLEALRSAAEAGQKDAQHILGLCYDNGLGGCACDRAIASHWYTKAAEQGHAEAQFCLGASYSEGSGVEQDLVKAREWYEKGAENGSVMAMYNTGVCYSRGDGCAIDSARAMYWYLQSAKGGFVSAQYNLARGYYYGKGVYQDLNKAEEWLEKAVAQQHTSAEKLLKKIRSGERVELPNPPKVTRKVLERLRLPMVECPTSSKVPGSPCQLVCKDVPADNTGTLYVFKSCIGYVCKRSPKWDRTWSLNEVTRVFRTDDANHKSKRGSINIVTSLDAAIQFVFQAHRELEFAYMSILSAWSKISPDAAAASLADGAAPVSIRASEGQIKPVIGADEAMYWRGVFVKAWSENVDSDSAVRETEASETVSDDPLEELISQKFEDIHLKSAEALQQVVELEDFTLKLLGDTHESKVRNVPKQKVEMNLKKIAQVVRGLHVKLSENFEVIVQAQSDLYSSLVTADQNPVSQTNPTRTRRKVPNEPDSPRELADGHNPVDTWEDVEGDEDEPEEADTNTAVISVRDMIKNLEAMSTLKGDRSDDASMQRRDVSRESKGHSAASIMVHPTSARDVSELSRDIMSIMNAED